MYQYIVLASSSERRIELLRRLIPDLVVMKPKAEEVFHDNPYETVYINSRSKALSIYDDAPEKSIVIGIDTVIYSPSIGVIGKPRDISDARRILSSLSNALHMVVSGVYLVDKPFSRDYSFYVTSYVKFSKLLDEDIEWYLSSNEWVDKAGGYGVQGYAGLFVEWILGDYYNIVGVPLNSIWRVLKRIYGYDILKVK